MATAAVGAAKNSGMAGSTIWPVSSIQLPRGRTRVSRGAALSVTITSATRAFKKALLHLELRQFKRAATNCGEEYSNVSRIRAVCRRNVLFGLLQGLYQVAR